MRGRLRRNRRVRLALLTVVVLAAALGVAAMCLFIFRSPINLSSFERIQLGMTIQEVTAIVRLPPGYYDVSPAEQFVLQEHEGKIAFGGQGHEEVETAPAEYDIRSRTTGQTVARLRKWANADNAIFIITKDERVIGKLHCDSLTSFNRWKFLRELRRRLGV
jgi:hypothetical protein